MKNRKAHKIVLGLVMAAILLAMLKFLGHIGVGLILIFFFIGAIWEYKNNLGPKISLEFGAKNYVFFGALLIGIPFIFAWAITYRFGWLAALFLAFNICLTDALGFLYGMLFERLKVKRHPIAKEINEGKSWEVAIAAVITTTLFCTFVAFQFVPHDFISSYRNAFALSFFGSIGAAIGDLVESKFKRMAGLKDSSGALQTHGGFLDRLDSTIGTAAVYICYFALKGLFR